MVLAALSDISRKNTSGCVLHTSIRSRTKSYNRATLVCRKVHSENVPTCCDIAIRRNSGRNVAQISRPVTIVSIRAAIGPCQLMGGILEPFMRSSADIRINKYECMVMRRSITVTTPHPFHRCFASLASWCRQCWFWLAKKVGATELVGLDHVLIRDPFRVQGVGLACGRPTAESPQT